MTTPCREDLGSPHAIRERFDGGSVMDLDSGRIPSLESATVRTAVAAAILPNYDGWHAARLRLPALRAGGKRRRRSNRATIATAATAVIPARRRRVARGEIALSSADDEGGIRGAAARAGSARTRWPGRNPRRGRQGGVRASGRQGEIRGAAARGRRRTSLPGCAHGRRSTAREPTFIAVRDRSVESA